MRVVVAVLAWATVAVVATPAAPIGGPRRGPPWTAGVDLSAVADLEATGAVYHDADGLTRPGRSGNGYWNTPPRRGLPDSDGG